MKRLKKIIDFSSIKWNKWFLLNKKNNNHLMIFEKKNNIENFMTDFNVTCHGEVFIGNKNACILIKNNGDIIIRGKNIIAQAEQDIFLKADRTIQLNTKEEVRLKK